MSLEKISQIEQVLHSLKSQRDYIDQLKLAMQLSSPLSSSSSSSARAIPTVGHNYDPHSLTPESEKILNDGTLTAVTTTTTTSKANYPNTGTVLLTYPGNGLLDTEDCQIFSANALALKDCYENVLLSIALSRQGDSVAVQIHLPGVAHTVDTTTASSSSSSITDMHIDPTTSTTTTTTNSVINGIACPSTDGSKHILGTTTPVGIPPSHQPDVDSASYQLGTHSHTHSQSQYRTLSDYLNIIEMPPQINNNTCIDKGYGSEGSYASYLIDQLSERLHVKLILPKVSHTLSITCILDISVLLIFDYVCICMLIDYISCVCVLVYAFMCICTCLYVIGSCRRSVVAYSGICTHICPGAVNRCTGTTQIQREASISICDTTV